MCGEAPAGPAQERRTAMEYAVKRMERPDWGRADRVELTDTGWLPPAPVRAARPVSRYTKAPAAKSISGASGTVRNRAG